MNRGCNLALENNYLNRILYESNSEKKCVFVSHKNEDIDTAKNIAELLQNAGLDVYLDVNDNGLQQATRKNDAEAIVKCIEKALACSTHILILVTENTEKSWWVPYETGYAKKSKKNIASILMKKVENFPDYLKIERKLWNLRDLKQYIIELSGKSYYPLFESNSEINTYNEIENILKDSIRA